MSMSDMVMHSNDTANAHGTADCDAVRAWLQAAAKAGSSTLPPVWVCEHIASCARCRGALALLAVALALPSPPSAIDCATCEEDLAAYIDIEVRSGVAAAQQAYPEVWWHLWVCPSCLESYTLIKALVAAEQEGALPPPPLLPTMPRLLRTIRLGRDMLNYALPIPAPQLGATRGRRDATAVLLDEDEATAGYQFALRVQQEHDTSWTITGTASPPIAGRLVAVLGTASFAAPFDAQGTAVIRDVPASLLIAGDGPDLVCHLELDAGA